MAATPVPVGKWLAGTTTTWPPIFRANAPRSSSIVDAWVPQVARTDVSSRAVNPAGYLTVSLDEQGGNPSSHDRLRNTGEIVVGPVLRFQAAEILS
jgi:hypothetical protein